MRILVVEDEPVAAAVLAKGLREHSYAVDVAGDGDAAFEQATINDYDLLILDVLLPGMNGLELCGRLRAEGVATPVLMLTARGEPDQRVEGTAAAVAIGIARGADIIRVHDVREMARVAKMTDAIVRSNT